MFVINFYLHAVIYKVIRNRCEDGRRHFKNRVLKRQKSFEEVVGPNVVSLPLEDLVKEKAVSLLIELRAKGNIPYTESLDFIRRLSTFVDILISSTLKSFNQAFLGISEVNEVFEKIQHLMTS